MNKDSIPASHVELQAMILGRDVLMEHIFRMTGQDIIADLWKNTTEDLDKAILSDALHLDDLVDNVHEEMTKIKGDVEG
jgi:hypothetical protein